MFRNKFTAFIFLLIAVFLLSIGCSGSTEEGTTTTSTTTTTTINGSSTTTSTTTTTLSKSEITLFLYNTQLSKDATIDIGTVTNDSSSDNIALVIKNTGTLPLSINSITITGGNWKLSKTKDVTVDADHTTDLILNKLGGTAGDFVIDTLSINSNADNIKAFKLNFRSKIIDEFKIVPLTKGTFNMGYVGVTNATPVHSVTLSAYSISNYEITYEFWNKIYLWAIKKGYEFTNVGVKGKDGSVKTTKNHPVTHINWYDAVKWCNAYSEEKGLIPCYYTSSAKSVVYRTGNIDLSNDCVNWTATGYRLPTEAEWEYAARNSGARNGDEYSGSNNLSEVGVYASNSNGYTSYIAGMKANEFGIYDMSGNVAEWCWDYYEKYTTTSSTDPKGPASGDVRIVRGGAYTNSDILCRNSYRFIIYFPKASVYDVGFRVVKGN